MATKSRKTKAAKRSRSETAMEARPAAPVKSTRKKKIMADDYVRAKTLHPSDLIACELDAVFELFDRDAEIAANALGIALESRPSRCVIPSSLGVPYFAKLVTLGHQVRIINKSGQCEAFNCEVVPMTIEAERKAPLVRRDDEEASVELAVAEWRFAEAETDLQKSADGGRSEALERKIMAMPAARIYDVIAKLDVLDRWLTTQHSSGEPFEDCRDIAMLGSIKADLKSIAKLNTISPVCRDGGR